MKSTSIIDVPKNANEEDLFGISKYEVGLCRFIKGASTPLTVAIQGEWGSGKTSLMNTLNRRLCDSTDAAFYSVWINTWEFALLKDEYTTLIQVTKALLDATLTVFKDSHVSNLEAIQGRIGAFLKKAAITAGKVGLNKAVNGVGDDFATFIESNSQETSIRSLRDELEDSIRQTIDKEAEKGGAKKGFIFFIDDLDRIDPPVAVKILELLKNIFDLENCVFVLAIDYDVIVKGLKPKFGELTDSNEREFRSFFDKIIQLPFSMPVATYTIDKFLVNTLQSIEYFSEEQLQDKTTLKQLGEISTLSVGTNPRALKRLLNSLSLIHCINDEGDGVLEPYALLVNYALVNIQISYPTIYRLLVKDPSFELWDENLAKQLGLAGLDAQSKEELESMKEFDEEWEQVLYRFCEKDHFLKRKALNISRLLNLIKTLVPDDENIGDVIGDLISLSSVTNLEAFDSSVVAMNKSHFLKTLVAALLPKLKKGLAGRAETVTKQGKRVQSNAYIKFTRENWREYIGFTPTPLTDGIRLQIHSHVWCRNIPVNSTFEEDLKNSGHEDAFNAINAQFEKLVSNHERFRIERNLFNFSYVSRKTHKTAFECIIDLESPEAANNPQAIEEISAIVLEMYPLIHKLVSLVS